MLKINCHNLSVVAIVVTYNRKILLEQCLHSVLAQSIRPEKIIIIDNNSNDGTFSHLTSSGLFNELCISYIHMDSNQGGAGGFYQGIKVASDQNIYDFFWCMDDDCIPEFNALEKLLSPVKSHENIGFICSRVNWSDGSPHLMNIPSIRMSTNNTPFNIYDDEHILLVRSCSFVSILVSNIAIKKIGFPLKEMFIWGDDIEFTTRIVQAGFLGLYAMDSKVTHLTIKNINDDIFNANKDDSFKFFYGIRNDLYFKRKNNGVVNYLFSLIYRLSFFNIKIFLRRKDFAWLFIFINIRASVMAVFFYPLTVFPNA